MSSDGPPFIGSLSRVLWQWVRTRIHEAVTGAGFDDLNPAHIGVFRYPSPDGMRPTELADELQITKQSVNELLGHLENRGYLVREVDPADSRGRRIRLTDRGKLLQDVVFAAAASAEAEAAGLVGRDRIEQLKETLLDLSGTFGLPPRTVG